MNLILQLVLICSLLDFIDSFSAKLNIISDYFNKNNVQFCYILTCWSTYDNFEVHKELSSRNIRSTFIHPNGSNFNNNGYILDISCGNSHQILSEVHHLSFRYTQKWLIFATSQVKWRKYFEGVRLRLDSNVKLVVSQNYRHHLLDIYNLGFNLGGSLKVNVESYHNSNSFFFNHTHLFYGKRKDLTGIHLRSATVILRKAPSINFTEYMTNPRYKHLDPISKFHWALFQILQEVHNFSHNVSFADKWFGNTPHGIDDGVGKLLWDNVVDISSTGALLTAAKVSVVDFLQPSYYLQFAFFFQNPTNNNPLSNQFARPFSINTWLSIGIIIIIISILFSITFKLENLIMDSRRLFSFVSILLIILSAFVQQGITIALTQFSGRLIFLSLLIFSILIYNYYTSLILSALLSKPQSTINTLEELAHSNLKIGIEVTPYTLRWLNLSRDQSLKFIYHEKVLKENNFLDIADGIARIRRYNFAYHTTADTAFPLIENTFEPLEICNLLSVPLVSGYLGLISQKYSQYTELFSITLRKIQERGLLNRIIIIWHAKKLKCLIDFPLMPVNLYQAFFAFMILFMGILIALILFILELLWVFLKLDLRLRNLKDRLNC